MNIIKTAMLLCGVAVFCSCEKDPQPSYLLTIGEPLGFMVDSIVFEDGNGYAVNCPAFLADSAATLIWGAIQSRGHYASHVTAHYQLKDVAGYPYVNFSITIGSTTDRPAYLILHSPTGRKAYEF